MPRGMARRHNHFAECESFAVFDFFGIKTVLCAPFTAGVNLCVFQSCAELTRSAHQIGMNMGFKDMCDNDAGVPGRFNVNIAISSRIEYRRDSLVIVADEIRKLSDSFRLNCLKNE